MTSASADGHARDVLLDDLRDYRQRVGTEIAALNHQLLAGESLTWATNILAIPGRGGNTFVNCA